MQVNQLIRQHFPGVEVVPSTYPLAPFKALLVNVGSVVQFVGFGVIFGGDKVFEMMGVVPPPAWYTANVGNNKVSAAMGLWFVGNMVLNSLRSTGAFEVYYDGQLIFSKLEANHMPTGDELFGPLIRLYKQRQQQAGLEARGGAAGAAEPPALRAVTGGGAAATAR